MFSDIEYKVYDSFGRLVCIADNWVVVHAVVDKYFDSVDTLLITLEKKRRL